MNIRKLTTRVTFGIIGLAATAGLAAAAEPWTVLDGVQAVPMTSGEMGQVLAKNNFQFVEQNGFFYIFQNQITGETYTGYIVPGNPAEGDTISLTLSGVDLPLPDGSPD
jgi:predicted RNA binding protein YcfA (HicA-like mRNA interferase family)